MAKRTRRKHSAAFEAKVTMAAMVGDKTLAELAQHSIGFFASAKMFKIESGKIGHNRKVVGYAAQHLKPSLSQLLEEV